MFVKFVKFVTNRRSLLGEAVVTRRDRSLGGKEVVVGNVSRGRVLGSPLESREFTSGSGMFKGFSRNWGKRKGNGNKLPDWWPKNSSVSVSLVDDNEEYQRQANRLIRGLFIVCIYFDRNVLNSILLMTSIYHHI